MPRKRIAAELEDADADDQPIGRRRRRRPRWRRRFALLVVGAVALVVFGPAIVANTPLRNALVSRAVPSTAARLSSSGGSFSWVAGQSLKGVALADAEGNPIATIESASIDRSLVALAANRRSLGKIVVTRPVIHVETRDATSNIETLIERLAAAAEAEEPSPEEKSTPTTLASIEVIDGAIRGRDAVTGQEWRIDGLNLTASPTPSGAWSASGGGVLTLATANSGASRAVSAPAPAAPTPDSAIPGRFKFQFTGAESTTDADARTEHQLELLTDELPLAPLEPWLARILPGARIVGTTSADLKITWQKAGDGIAGPASDAPPTGDAIAGFVKDGGSTPSRRITASGKLNAAGVRFTAAALSGDLLELNTASMAIDATLAGAQLSARQFHAKSEWLEAEGAGEFDLAQFASLSPEQLPASDASLTARFDLPQAARMLPRTLRLRPGVRIDSGSFEVSAHSTREDAGRSWKVAAAVKDLLGNDGRQPIRWTDPVEAAVNLTEVADRPQLKRAFVRSPFASLLVDGAASGLEGQVEFDLDKLAAQLGQFVDLSAWQLRGTGAGTFSWRDSGADKFAASAGADLKNIDVRKGGRVVWVDPELRVEFQSTGQRFPGRAPRIDAGTALMRGPRDTIDLELLEPADLAAANRSWFVRIKGSGPLDSWAGRLRPWVAAVPEELAGQSTIDARVRLGQEGFEISDSNFTVRGLRTRLAGKELVEPQIEAHGDLRWDRVQRALQSKDMQFASRTVAARFGDLDVRLADQGPPTVRGLVAFRGDMERVAAWAGLMGVPGGLWPRGQAVGRMQLASDADRASATLTLSAEPFTLVRGMLASSSGLTPHASSLEPSVAWNDPKLQLATEIAYTHADDRLQLANLRLDGQTVRLTGAGVVDQLRTAGLLRGEVNVTYDSAELTKLLTTYLGPGAKIEGATPVRLIATGRLPSEASRAVPGPGAAASAAPPSSLEPQASSLPHWSRRWQLTAETSLAAANLYGLPIGPAALVANIRDGQIQFNPLDLAVGQGRLTAQPRVLLDPPPGQLQLAAGPFVSNVAVSAEVSDAMLKYAAPILASATRISGSFSLITDGVQLPLGDPKQVRTSGRLTMHQLAILPGPGLAEVITLIQRLEQISRGRENLLGAVGQPARPVKGISMNDRTIDVQVVDGRVYHRNLEFLVDDVPVSSYGSVGFDQTIALVIRVPVQAKWVGSEPALQGLIGQVIEIPVSGTFTRWKVDERAVGNFLAQAAQTAVGGAIGNEINKALDGLFRRK